MQGDLELMIMILKGSRTHRNKLLSICDYNVESLVFIHQMGAFNFNAWINYFAIKKTKIQTGLVRSINNTTYKHTKK